MEEQGQEQGQGWRRARSRPRMKKDKNKAKDEKGQEQGQGQAMKCSTWAEQSDAVGREETVEAAATLAPSTTSPILIHILE